MKTICYFFLLTLLTTKSYTQTYCPVSFPAGVTPITEVSFGEMNHSSSSSSNSDFENFTNFIDTVTAGVVQILVRGNTGGNFTDSVTAYFDWNANGSFTDAGESYTIGAIINSTGGINESAAISLISPPFSLPGNGAVVRTRIIKKRGAIGTSCNNSGIGQAEDYAIYINPGPPCSGTPNAGTAAGPSYICNGVPFTLSIQNYSFGFLTNWQWEESPVGMGVWTAIPGATTPTYISQGITQNKEYRIMASCANASGFDLSNVVNAYNAVATFTDNSPLCVGDTLNVSMNACASCSVSITGPAFTGSQSFSIPNIGLSSDGWYYYSVTDNGCNNTSVTDSFYIDVSSCQDSVWPGDVNTDKITNNLDALYLALHNGYFGVQRKNATISYIAQACPDWNFSFNNINLKHADCNGDGFVNITDTIAIALNYNLSHLKSTNTPKAKISGAPDLYFDITGIRLIGNGMPVSIPVMMGTSTAPVQNLLGLAAELKLDGTSLNQPLYTGETGSWLNYQMAFKKSIAPNRMDITYSRTSGTGAYGYGVLFYVNLVLPNSSIGDTVNLYFDNVTMLDPQGNILTNYNVLPLTMIVEDPLSINDQEVIQYASVIPNPSSGHTELEISSQNNSLIIVTINDMTGKILWRSTISGNRGIQHLQLPEKLNAGMYMVNIITDNKKPGVLKWQKL